MKQKNKDILLRLLQQHKALGISDQIDFDKFYLYSIITNSAALADIPSDLIEKKVVDKSALKQEMVDKARGGNKNRTYIKQADNA